MVFYYKHPFTEKQKGRYKRESRRKKGEDMNRIEIKKGRRVACMHELGSCTCRQMIHHPPSTWAGCLGRMSAGDAMRLGEGPEEKGQIEIFEKKKEKKKERKGKKA